MKKTLILLVVFIGVLLCAVGYSDSQYRTGIGHETPPLALRGADSLFSLDRKRGDYVILNFWKTTDAPSRRQVNEYTAWLRSNPEKDVSLVSVNLDDSRAMFNEIVRLDRLMPQTQFYADGENARAIVDNFGLEKGLGSLLIAPDGIIVGHNPTDAQLSSIR